MVRIAGLRNRECHCAQRFGGRDAIHTDGRALICPARHDIVDLISVDKKRRDCFVTKDPKSSELTAWTPHFMSKVVSSAGGCGQLIITLMWMRPATFDVETGVFFFAGQDATHILLKCINPNQTSG